MSEQEIFDATCEHLAKQKHRSMAMMQETFGGFGGGKTVETCAYRGKDGDKCAYGLFIPDDEYQAAMESQTCTTLARNGYIAPAFRGEDPTLWISEKHKILALELQSAHDTAYHADDLRTYLRNAAIVGGICLNTNKVDLITEWSK